MRQLLLLRHAKAEPAIGRDDYARALTERGRKDAEQVGAMIAERGLVPDLLIYSSAERTRETAEIVARRWPGAIRSLPERALYEATRPLILALIQRMPDQAASAMLVGHNPGMADIATQLAGEGPDFDRQRMAAKYPTSGLAVLDFACESWADVRPRGGRLAAFLAPGDAAA